jgi:hypothetical protein
MKKQIDLMCGGRFISHYPGKVHVYYDNRSRIIKCEIGELVEELLPEPIVSNVWPKRSYRQQLETCTGSNGVSLIEFKLDAPSSQSQKAKN